MLAIQKNKDLESINIDSIPINTINAKFNLLVNILMILVFIVISILVVRLAVTPVLAFQDPKSIDNIEKNINKNIYNDISQLISSKKLFVEGNHYYTNLSTTSITIADLNITSFLDYSNILRIFIGEKPTLPGGIILYDYLTLKPFERSIIIGADKDPTSASVEFLPNNSFILIKDNEKLEIGAGLNIELELKNRESQGLIPILIIKGKGNDYYAQVIDGQYQLQAFSKGLYYNRLNNDYDTTPLSIVILSQTNTSLVSMAGYNKTFYGRLIITNYGELALIPENQTSGGANIISGFQCGHGLASESVFINSQNYSKLLMQEFPDIVFKGNVKEETAKALYDTLKLLTPDLIHPIRAIILYNNTDFNTNFKSISNGYINAWTSNDRIIRLKSSSISCSVIAHEAAHVRTFFLGNSFIKQWLSVAGDVYGKGISKDMQTWIDNSSIPKNGCIRPYGCVNVLEDIATLTEAVYSEPELVTNASVKDERFLKKLTLLHRYGFISTYMFESLLSH